MIVIKYFKRKVSGNFMTIRKHQRQLLRNRTKLAQTNEETSLIHSNIFSDNLF